MHSPDFPGKTWSLGDDAHPESLKGSSPGHLCGTHPRGSARHPSSAPVTPSSSQVPLTPLPFPVQGAATTGMGAGPQFPHH